MMLRMPVDFPLVLQLSVKLMDASFNRRRFLSKGGVRNALCGFSFELLFVSFGCADDAIDGDWILWQFAPISNSLVKSPLNTTDKSIAD